MEISKKIFMRAILLVGLLILSSNFSLSKIEAEKYSGESYADLSDSGEFQVTYFCTQKIVGDSPIQSNINTEQVYKSKNIVAVKNNVTYIYTKYEGFNDEGFHKIEKNGNEGFYKKDGKGNWIYLYGVSKQNRPKEAIISIDGLFGLEGKIMEILSENAKKKWETCYQEIFGVEIPILPYIKSGFETVNDKQLSYEEYGNEYVVKRYYFDQKGLNSVVTIYKPADERLENELKTIGSIDVLEFEKIDRKIDGEILDLMVIVEKEGEMYM